MSAISPCYRAQTLEVCESQEFFCIKALKSMANLIKKIVCAIFSFITCSGKKEGLGQTLQRFAQRDGYILFYDRQNPLTYFLGNFYPCPVSFDGRAFLCSEAAYQAAKFTNYPHMQNAIACREGHASWRLAQDNQYLVRTDWNQVNQTVMERVLHAKFDQNPELKNLLLATGSAYLVEHTSNDSFWGDGGDGYGENRLGHMLMRERQRQGGIGIVEPPLRYQQFCRETRPQQNARVANIFRSCI